MFKNNGDNPDAQDQELIFTQAENKENKSINLNTFKYTNINLSKINYCIQNVDWEDYNILRDETIRNYEIHRQGNRNNPIKSPDEELKVKNFQSTKETDIYYTFSEYFINVEPKNFHFQLRKNLIFVSKNELVYFNTKGVELLNIISKKTIQILYFNEEDEKVLCFDAFKYNKNEIHFVFGLFNNRILIIKIKIEEKLRKPFINIFYKQILLISNLEEQNQLINFVRFSDDKNYIYTSCNDGFIKIFDYNTMQLVNTFKSKSCVNHFSYNHNQNIIAAVGDFEEVHLIDPKSNKDICYLNGHYDFGFVSKFKPESDYYLATGNQDFSCKIWDLRKINNNDLNFENLEENNSCLKTIFGNCNCIGDLKFIENELLALLEDTINFHIVNLKDFKMQTIKYIGEGVGVNFSPHTKKLYFGVSINSHSGIYAFKKINNFIDTMDLKNFI